MKINMRKKTLPVLMMNRRSLANVIATYRRQRRNDEAEHAEKILRDTIAELKRRGVEA